VASGRRPIGKMRGAGVYWPGGQMTDGPTVSTGVVSGRGSFGEA